MHKCILKPLKDHVEMMLKEFHTADGSWKQLKENLQLVRQRNPQELGVFVPTPDFVDVEKIKVKFMAMQKMYSPEKKVMLLLRVCKLIYTVMENNSGKCYIWPKCFKLFRDCFHKMRTISSAKRNFTFSFLLVYCNIIHYYSILDSLNLGSSWDKMMYFFQSWCSSDYQISVRMGLDMLNVLERKKIRILVAITLASDFLLWILYRGNYSDAYWSEFKWCVTIV